MKMKMKMKNRSHRYGISRPRSRHGYKYGKYKKCLTMIMFICIKKKLSSTEAELKKSVYFDRW